jgi:filamentous hemagglutinin
MIKTEISDYFHQKTLMAQPLGTGDSKNSNAGNNSIGAGFNVGSDNTDMAWVGQQTSLTGNSVNINVGNKTTLTGAIIASTSEDAILTLKTKELEYNDLKDLNTSESSGFGLSTSVGIKNSKATANGSTTMSIKSTGESQEQTNKATIGQGTIIVNGKEQTDEDLKGLNRNITYTQEIGEKIITGALDGSVTIDNRWLTKAGRESIMNDFTNLGVNLVKAGAGAISTTISPIVAAYDSLTAQENKESEGENTKYDKKDIISVWKANQSANATGILRGADDVANSIIDKIKSGTASPEEIQMLAQMAADGKGNLMYSEKGELKNSQTGEIVLGFNDVDNHQGYVNLANGAATNALTFALTDAEERAHNYTSNEDIAKGAARSELAYYNAVAWLTGGSEIGQGSLYSGNQIQNIWNATYNASNNLLLMSNTELANGVKNEDKSFSTYVKMSADGKTGKVIDAKDDGDTNIYDEKGNVVGKTLFADEFIMYGSDNISKGPAVGNIIYFNTDKTDFINNAVKQALGERLDILALKSSNRGEYDVKYQINGTDRSKDYDGYLYNGAITTARGLGNILFGRNWGNTILLNDIIKIGAGMYHQSGLSEEQKSMFKNSNVSTPYGETDEAMKHIELGLTGK